MKRLLPLIAVLATAGQACSSGIDVDPFVPDSVAVTPETASMLQGDTLRLLATALDQNGVAFLGPEFTWISGNPSVALVDPDGLVSGGLPGTATVIATFRDLTGSAQITVSARPFAVLSPGSLTFNATAGGTDPPVQAVAVANAGGGGLSNVTVGGVTYGTGQATGWLTASLSGDFATLTIKVAIGGLGAGSYNATVPVGIGGSTAAGATLTVTLVLT